MHRLQLQDIVEARGGVFFLLKYLILETVVVFGVDQYIMLPSHQMKIVLCQKMQG